MTDKSSALSCHSEGGTDCPDSSGTEKSPENRPITEIKICYYPRFRTFARFYTEAT